MRLCSPALHSKHFGHSLHALAFIGSEVRNLVQEARHATLSGHFDNLYINFPSRRMQVLSGKERKGFKDVLGLRSFRISRASDVTTTAISSE